MVFVALGSYRSMRVVSDKNGVTFRMVMMGVAVRQRLAGRGEGGDHDEHRREMAVEGAAVHGSKLRSCCPGG